MKQIRKSIFIVPIVVVIVACGVASSAPVATATTTPNIVVVSPSITPSPTPITTATLTGANAAKSDEIVFNKISTTNNSETKLNNQCLNITNAPPNSNSVIVLRSLHDVVAYAAPDLILVDMSETQPRETIEKTQITPSFAVSADGKLIAYEASTIKDRKVTKLELVIANGNFQTQSSILWNDQWDRILGWTTDRKIIISLLIPGAVSDSLATYVLVDPLSGAQKVTRVGVSDLLDASLYDLPYWNGWHGLLIDPTHSFAIYPRLSESNKETYTYALWDISKNMPMFGLEKIFTAFPQFIGSSSSLPAWSIDGTQFAFVAVHQDQDVLPIKFELFLVNRDGNIKQLTNLSSIGYVWPSFHSWSPDNTHIGFFLSPQLGAANENANVFIVNTNTLEVTDLCLSIGFQGAGSDEPITPIWSPNGKQLLIVDRYQKDHQRILLIDIEKNIVFPIAEDVEPIGWMTKP